ncbi:MAG: amidase [Vicinamibacterales bacterium]
MRRVSVASVEPALTFLVPAAPAVVPRRRKPAVRPVVAWPFGGTTREDVAFAPAAELAERLRRRRVSSTELTHLYLDRLARFDPDLLCAVTVTRELALEQAARADEEIAAGRYRGPLHGLPYGLKDLVDTSGIRTTWGAAPYATRIPDHDATVYERLRDAGAVLVAKLSTGELANGDVWFGGRTRNPWNIERGSGGSSAGPAAATAAGLVAFAIGTETNGSVVSPSNVCGVTGLRPTYGRVSRDGVMALRWTLDKVGVIARTAADAALVLDAIYGPDGRDTGVADVPFRWAPRRSLEGVRIGVLEAEFEAPLEVPGSIAPAGDTTPIFRTALEQLRLAGGILRSVSLPDFPTAAMYAMCNAEAGAAFDELVRSGGVDLLTDRTPAGRANQLRWAQFIPAVEYLRAQRLRTRLIQNVQALFDDIDVLVSPSDSAGVVTTNFTGHPAISVNCGFVGDMPLGMMFTGRYHEEEALLAVAHAFQARTTWHLRRPPRMTAPL